MPQKNAINNQFYILFSLLYKHCYDPLQYTELNLQPYWTKVCEQY